MENEDNHQQYQTTRTLDMEKKPPRAKISPGITNLQLLPNKLSRSLYITETPICASDSRDR